MAWERGNDMSIMCCLSCALLYPSVLFGMAWERSNMTSACDALEAAIETSCMWCDWIMTHAGHMTRVSDVIEAWRVWYAWNLTQEKRVTSSWLVLDLVWLVMPCMRSDWSMSRDKRLSCEVWEERWLVLVMLKNRLKHGVYMIDMTCIMHDKMPMSMSM